MKKIMFSFIVIFNMTSCSSALSIVENTNSNKKFEDKRVYLEFVNKKTGSQYDKVVILDSDQYIYITNEIISKKLSTYYGIANANYFLSAEQLENKSCTGQIETLYKMFENNSDKIVKTETSGISFLEKLNLDASKNTLLFIYSYKLGGLSKTKIARVIKDLNINKNFDYRILSLDKYDILHE